MKTSTSLAMAHGALLLGLVLAMVLALRPMQLGTAAHAPAAAAFEVRLTSHLSRTGSPHFETFIKRAASGDGGGGQALDARAHCSQDGVCTVTLRIALPQADHHVPEHKTAEMPFSAPLPEPASKASNNQPTKEDEHLRYKNVKIKESLRQEDQNSRDHEEKTATSKSESRPAAPHGIPIPQQQHPLHHQPPFQHFQECVQSQLPKCRPQQWTESSAPPQPCYQSHPAPRPCFLSQHQPQSCCPFQSFPKSTTATEGQAQPEEQVENEHQAQTQHSLSPHDEPQIQPQEQYEPVVHSIPSQPQSQLHSPVQSRAQTSFQIEEEQQSLSQLKSHYQFPLHQHQSDRQNYSKPELQQRYTDINEEAELQSSQQQLTQHELQSQFQQQMQPYVTQQEAQFGGGKEKLPMSHFNSDWETSPERLQENTNGEVDFASNILSEKQRDKKHLLQIESVMEKPPEFWRTQSYEMRDPDQLVDPEIEYLPSNEYPEEPPKTQLYLDPTSMQYEQRQQDTQSIITLSQDILSQSEGRSQPPAQSRGASDKQSICQDGRCPWAKTNHYTIPHDDEQRQNSKDNTKKDANFRGRPRLTA